MYSSHKIYNSSPQSTLPNTYGKFDRHQYNVLVHTR